MRQKPVVSCRGVFHPPLNLNYNNCSNTVKINIVTSNVQPFNLCCANPIQILKALVENTYIYMYIYRYIYTQNLSSRFLWVLKFDVKLGGRRQKFQNYSR